MHSGGTSFPCNTGKLPLNHKVGRLPHSTQLLCGHAVPGTSKTWANCPASANGISRPSPSQLGRAPLASVSKASCTSYSCTSAQLPSLSRQMQANCPPPPTPAAVARGRQPLALITQACCLEHPRLGRSASVTRSPVHCNIPVAFPRCNTAPRSRSPSKNESPLSVVA